jgi:GH35 family endo-1,4-beta-xylanase
MGHQPGIVEIAGVTVENLGPDPDLGAARAAIEPTAVQQRIERYRKADLTVQVTRKGKPVAGAQVRVEMKRHAFLFGCNFFGLEPANRTEAQKAYRDRWAALFNYATLPFYWGAFEPRKGEPQYDRLMGMARWCADHGIAAKGHPLVWHEVWPSWAPSDIDESIALLRARVLDLIPRYKGLIRYWDVQNEANASASYPRTGVGQWARRDGPAAMVATTLGWAREAARGLGDTLLYNDYDTGDANVALLTELKKRGALPDAIGIQSHMHGAPWPLEQVWAVAERFSRFGRPVHFTETTVVSGPIRAFNMQNPPHDWVTTPEDEARQADYVARFYSILFSHPNVQAITWWDFSDAGAWLNAPAGFLRKDMSPKPVYDRLMRLIHHEWWTDATGTTNRQGVFAVRAFQGDYQVVVSTPDGAKAGATFRIPIGGATKRVTVKLP